MQEVYSVHMCAGTCVTAPIHECMCARVYEHTRVHSHTHTHTRVRACELLLQEALGLPESAPYPWEPPHGHHQGHHPGLLEAGLSQSGKGCG